MDKQLKGTILVALSGVLYGTIGYFGTNLFKAGLSVVDLLLWRFLGSVLLLLPFMPTLFKKRLNAYQWKTLGLFFVLGAVCYGVGTELYFQASFMIGTGLAMVLFFTYPLLIVTYLALAHRTLPGFATGLSLVLITIGCLMIGWGDSALISWQGIILAVFSGLTYGVYIIVSKNRSQVLDPLLTTFIVCLGCVAVLVLDTLRMGQAFYIPQSLPILENIFLFSLLGTVLPILLLLQGVKLISATKTAIISVLEPVTVLAVGVIFLGEPVSALQAVGAVIILSGALVINVA